jgi:DNA-binding response OmpR family regulator
MNKILVVDDDRITGEMLKFAPGSKGYLAVVSQTGAKGSSFSTIVLIFLC